MHHLSSLITALAEAGFDPEAWELTDVLWLARYITPLDSAGPEPRSTAGAEQPAAQEPAESSGERIQPPGPVGGQLQQAETTVPLHIRRPAPAQAPAQPLGSRPFRTPTPLLLPQTLALGRALRPLLRRVVSRRRAVVDESATVHNFAELQVPLPVLRGVPERWLELALVMDRHESQVLWEPLLQELRRLLERHGAFRDLRLWRLGHDAAGKACVWPGLHGGTARKSAVLRDPEGRRVILLVSDYTAPAWRQGGYLDTLRDWSRHQPVALLHLLPQRLWRRTGLALGRFVELGGGGLPGAVNNQLHLSLDRLSSESSTPPDGQGSLKLPVLSLTPAALRAWSRLLAGRGEAWTAGVVFPADRAPSELQESPTPESPDAPLRLRRFRAGASPQAWDLARYCAAMPLTLPVARLVQETMLRDSLPAHLAEVFLGGLLKKAEHQLTEQPAPLDIIYEFHDGVRQRLIDSLTPPHLLDVLQRVSRQVEERLGRPHDFLARLADPTVFDPDSLLAPDSRPFAHIKLQVLRRLGGQYGLWAVQLADSLEKLRPPFPEPVPSGPKPFPQPGSSIPFRDPFLNSDAQGPEMVWLPGGTFTMGDDKSDQSDEKPAHRITLSPFSVGKYPVTFEDYDAFCEATGREKPSDGGWGRGRRPVINVSWDEAQEYCQWLSQQTGQAYRLLSEAQWEYACRAGSEAAYCFGDDANRLGEYAWYWKNAEERTHPVGEKEPNAWGLYDLHGNVWEWVQDWYGAYSKDAQHDPSGPETGSSRVLRGGGWGFVAGDCRSAFRDHADPGRRGDDLGFRLARLGALPSDPVTLPQMPIPGLRDTFKDGSPGPAMVWLPEGTFRMGDNTGFEHEKPVHEVTVSAFSIGQYPVTFEDYDRFCEATGRGKPDDRGWGRGTRPVIDISWRDAQAYCEWLSKQTRARYRLLTEAEWEYACRAGSSTRYCFGDDEQRLGDYAWYSKNARGQTHPVGEKLPNAWHLYDTHGNVWEWVQDWYGGYSEASQSNPSGPETGSHRVIRGGSWGDVAGDCRSAFRLRADPGARGSYLGFRLARDGAWPFSPFTLARQPAEKTPVQATSKPESRYMPYQGFRDTLQDGAETPGMIYLPGGTFKMGDIQGKGFDRERPVHEVTLEAFAIGRYPVTVGEFQRFIEVTGYRTEAEREDGAYVWDGKTWEKKSDANWRNPYFPQDERHPVVCVSWNDGVAYCDWLSEQTGERYSLLSEAEWEYACRASSETVYCFGDDEALLGEYAWYSSNSEGRTHPVGQKRANAWGLYDMHGNVFEWVRDWYGEYSKAPQRNPSGPEMGSHRVIRGGGWGSVAGRCRSAYRSRAVPGSRGRSLGFRLARRV